MEEDKNSQFFMYLVSSFELAAMQAMGKIKNPISDKIEVDLNQAQFSIDILDMLKIKTKGNLNDYENRFLDNTIGQLKLNFVDEKQKNNKRGEEPE